MAESKIDRASEYDIRRSLLEHYSSQTIAHATYLLTFAFIGVTLIGLHLTKIALVFILSILIAVAFRTSVRLLYWGALAHAIIRVPRDRGEDLISQMKPKPTDVGYYDVIAETFILHSAAINWMNHYHPPRNSIISLFGSSDVRNVLSWGLTILVFVIFFVLFWLGYPFFFAG
jgi:hypothetical protein